MKTKLDHEIDEGTAYGMKPATYNKRLVEVSPDTPMGELMRRYWQPCALSKDITSEKPQKIRLLGEDLIIFRDGQGNPGLVHQNCCHRGANLYYGRIEEDGIRCCYHGWKFDVKGNCIEQPAEVNLGRHRERFRQPWYPVEERYGLIYAYMGPPDKKPILPHWKHLENLDQDEELIVSADNPYGPDKNQLYTSLDFNWLQAFENTMDAPHLPWLHYYHSCDQITGAPLSGVFGDEDVPSYAFIKDLAGYIETEETDLGVKQGVRVPNPDGKEYIARNEAMIPNVAVVTTLINLVYFVPCDDTSLIMFMIFRKKRGENVNVDEIHEGKSWREMTEEEHQLSPGDYEAQSSIGRLPAHNREHLSPGDKAIGKLRMRLEGAVKDVAEGRNPPGLIFNENAEPLEISAHGVIPYEK